jgi:hypothetical protein
MTAEYRLLGRLETGELAELITDLKTGAKEEHKLRFTAGANTKLEAFLRGSK